jgi:hypothetical protein
MTGSGCKFGAEAEARDTRVSNQDADEVERHFEERPGGKRAGFEVE